MIQESAASKKELSEESKLRKYERRRERESIMIFYVNRLRNLLNLTDEEKLTLPRYAVIRRAVMYMENEEVAKSVYKTEMERSNKNAGRTPIIYSPQNTHGKASSGKVAVGKVTDARITKDKVIRRHPKSQ